jgi:opacity protein-like surface antigen
MKRFLLAVAVLIAAAPAAFASTASEREYQRGYNDCSQGRYDQEQHGESYKKGCRAAEDGQPAATPAGHQGGKAKISDLKGMDSIKAFDVMTSRGFTNVDTLTAGETIYGTYYNANTHQCVQLTSAHDRIEDIDDVPSHPKCH